MPSNKDPAYNTISAELGSHSRNLIEPSQSEPRIESLIQEVQANGYVIIPLAFSRADVDEAKAELTRLASSGQGGPAGTKGRNAFEGYKTGRIYALLDKSRVFDKFVSHPDVLALNELFSGPQDILPMPFTAFQFNRGKNIKLCIMMMGMSQCHGHMHRLERQGVMVTLDAFTETNGSTVVVPKSHLWDGKRWPAQNEASPIVMESGSILSGMAVVKTIRKANEASLNMQYCQPWIRPFENHILAVSWDKLSQIPPKVVDMMGYEVGIPMVGHVEGSSPLRAVSRRLDESRNGKSQNKTKL